MAHKKELVLLIVALRRSPAVSLIECKTLKGKANAQALWHGRATFLSLKEYPCNIAKGKWPGKEKKTHV